MKNVGTGKLLNPAFIQAFEGKIRQVVVSHG